jgi:hypothetical protein
VAPAAVDLVGLAVVPAVLVVPVDRAALVAATRLPMINN